MYKKDKVSKLISLINNNIDVSIFMKMKRLQLTRKIGFLLFRAKGLKGLESCF